METPSVRIRSIQRKAMVMLLLAGIINTLDRATLSVANPLVRHDLHLSIAQMGMLLSALLWAYSFSQLPTGVMIDRMGPRRVLALGLGLWSAAQLACGFVTGLGQFAIARILVGVGEGPTYTTGARVARDWFNLKRRGFAISVFISSTYIGLAIAPPLLTAMMLAYGWRWMFVIMGLLGLIVAVVWYAFYRDPSQFALTEEENRYRTEGDDEKSQHKVTFSEWRGLFRSATTWAMICGYFGVIYNNFLFTAWLPGYLEMERHMSIKRTGWVASIPYVFAIIGCYLAGYLIDYLTARGVSRISSRKYLLIGAELLAAVCVFGAAMAGSNFLCVAFLCGAMFCGMAAATSAWAMASVIGPANCTGSIGSVQNFGGYFGGALAPTITGFIVQDTGSFVPALMVGMGMCVFAALAYSTIRKPITTYDLMPASQRLAE